MVVYLLCFCGACSFHLFFDCACLSASFLCFLIGGRSSEKCMIWNSRFAISAYLFLGFLLFWVLPFSKWEFQLMGFQPAACFPCAPRGSYSHRRCIFAPWRRSLYSHLLLRSNSITVRVCCGWCSVQPFEFVFWFFGFVRHLGSLLFSFYLICCSAGLLLRLLYRTQCCIFLSVTMFFTWLRLFVLLVQVMRCLRDPFFPSLKPVRQSFGYFCGALVCSFRWCLVLPLVLLHWLLASRILELGLLCFTCPMGLGRFCAGCPTTGNVEQCHLIWLILYLCSLVLLFIISGASAELRFVRLGAA